ncbi:Haloacid dehalogenase domain protein hydrolase [Fibrobacter succinogenes subsp. succinogenes S85]|uniref:Haloacid dehalogenase domain protein hydrolase n=2 Tax=Fibrobacter succinogenes TaxID=833 RepID=A0ABM5LG93_FIBSS|nr:Haloacid dehalogenase domain protein hydrolase [Fibrobacter succinogenes subsp. succinogenes S85]
MISLEITKPCSKKMSILKKLQPYDVIFVDYFDTLVFRNIHSHQIYSQWAKVLLGKLDSVSKHIDEEQLVALRWKALQNLREKNDEPSYRDLIFEIFSLGNLEFFVDFNIFFELSYTADEAVELGCQYPNKEVVEILYSLKRQGKKLYLVSDFYMPRKAYESFLSAFSINNLFDDIFISSEHNASKRTGSLYKYALEKTNSFSQKVVMLGDSQKDDFKSALKQNIAAIRYFPFKHKLYTNLSKYLNWDYSKRVVALKSSWLYKNSIFEEYAVVLYAFIQRLYSEAKKSNAEKLAFLSRGGFFLQTLFDEYQKDVISSKEQIKSAYCLNSRKVCFAAKNDENAKSLLLKYLQQFKCGDSIFLVDEGWYNHSQQILASVSGWNTFGFYIGTRQKETLNIPNQCVRKGLLFDMGTKKPNTKYYGILCTNCSMYEQILTAPHGSVDTYYEEFGAVKALLKTNEKEKYLYDKYIRDMQERMLLHFKGMCAWLGNNEISLKQCAKIVLKSVVFNSKKRCEWLNDLDNNRFDNYTTGKSKDKTIKDVRINVFELLIHPDRYLGMFCKIQRKLVNHPLLAAGYYPLAFIFYLYVRIMSRV